MVCSRALKDNTSKDVTGALDMYEYNNNNKNNNNNNNNNTVWKGGTLCKRALLWIFLMMMISDEKNVKTIHLQILWNIQLHDISTCVVYYLSNNFVVVFWSIPGGNSWNKWSNMHIFNLYDRKWDSHNGGRSGVVVVRNPDWTISGVGVDMVGPNIPRRGWTTEYQQWMF